MSASDVLEVNGVGHVHAGTHDVFERGARLLQCLADDLQAQARLLVGALGWRRAIGWDRGRACDKDLVSDDDRTRKADEGLVG